MNKRLGLALACLTLAGATACAGGTAQKQSVREDRTELSPGWWKVTSQLFGTRFTSDFEGWCVAELPTRANPLPFMKIEWRTRARTHKMI